MAESVNALAPKTANTLKNLVDHPNPTQYLMQLASEQPEYAGLANYLISRNAMPPIGFRRLFPGTKGQFQSYYLGADVPKTGKITLNSEYLDRAYAPTASIPTLTHELTHAAQNQMLDQQFQTEITDPQTKEQFLDAYKKLIYDRDKPIDNRFAQSKLAEKLSPMWSDENARYRTSITELPAFAMGNVVRKDFDGYKSPPHLDTTLATEYQILLDLATRDAKANPRKKTR